jgi:hypothetical protein
MSTEKTFNIYVNGSNSVSEYDCLGVIPATKAAAKAWIKERVLSTHMGEWFKIDTRTQAGYEYRTSIGREYRFLRLK